MAWIESHQKILNHPKTLELSELMGWDVDQTIGKLHRFWWWCVDYAEDGDLRKHNDNRIAQAVGVLPGESAKRFVDAMCQSCWIDSKPYFRVHDWWDWAGTFLRSRYSHSPEKWQSIRQAYAKHTTPIQSNPTEPIQTKEYGFDLFWKAYPKREGKDKALESWIKKDCHRIADDIVKAVELSKKKNEKWTPNKKGETFIPLPATWLNQGRWQDQFGSDEKKNPANPAPVPMPVAVPTVCPICKTTWGRIPEDGESPYCKDCPEPEKVKGLTG